MTLWKVIIEGQTEMDSHGVGLREMISKLASEQVPKVEGKVRNVKGSKIVEIVCRATEDSARGFVERVRKELADSPLIDLGKLDFKLSSPMEDQRIEDSIRPGELEVIREDDLTEMVWALQTAGRAVLSQETVRARNILRAVLSELSLVQNFVNEATQSEEDRGRRLNLISIEEFISNPIEKVGYDAIIGMHELYDSCELINHRLDKGFDYKDAVIKDAIAYIREKINQLMPAVNDLAKRMNICFQTQKVSDVHG